MLLVLLRLLLMHLLLHHLRLTIGLGVSCSLCLLLPEMQDLLLGYGLGLTLPIQHDVLARLGTGKVDGDADLLPQAFEPVHGLGVSRGARVWTHLGVHLRVHRSRTAFTTTERVPEGCPESCVSRARQFHSLS